VRNINKIYSTTWQHTVNPGVHWNSFFNINNPHREMYLKGLYFSVMYVNEALNTYISEDQNITQRAELIIQPAGASVNLFTNTGGAVGETDGWIYVYRSVNLKFERFLFEGTIPFVLNAWNNDADIFRHHITLSVEVEEILK
jgi:hypothetical protein